MILFMPGVVWSRYMYSLAFMVSIGKHISRPIVPDDMLAMDVINKLLSSVIFIIIKWKKNV